MTAAWSGIAIPVSAWLIAIIGAGLLVSMITLTVGNAIPRRCAAARVTVWRSGLMALLFLPVASLTIPWSWTIPGTDLWLERAMMPLIPVDGTPMEPGNAMGLLIWVWALVAVSLLGYVVVGYATLRLHSRRARDVTSEMADIVPIRPGMRVLRGGPLAMPGCWGVFRPVVLLPAASDRWNAARLRAVILHETAHVERRDPLFLALAQLACALHWVNPVAWRIQRALLRDGEAICDDRVICSGVARRDYARILLAIAAEYHSAPRVALLTMARGGLSHRITDLLDGRIAPPPHRGVVRMAACVPMIVALIAASGAAPLFGGISGVVRQSRYNSRKTFQVTTKTETRTATHTTYVVRRQSSD